MRSREKTTRTLDPRGGTIQPFTIQMLCSRHSGREPVMYRTSIW